MRSTAATVLLMLAFTGAAGGAATRKTYPGSATGEAKFRPDRSTAAADAKQLAQEALERSCRNLARGKRTTVSKVKLVSLTASNSSAGWDVTVMLSGTCTVHEEILVHDQ